MPVTTAASLPMAYSADTRSTQRSPAPSSRPDAAATAKIAKLAMKGAGSLAPCVESDGGKEEGCCGEPVEETFWK